MADQIQNQPKWYNDSILIKLAVITVLILILLIPSAWIQGLISDRDSYQQQELASVADKWSGTQLIQGPVLVVPYKKTTEDKAGGTKDVIETLYVLPQNLQIKAGIKTELFKNGMYDAIVYNSEVGVKGDFDKPALSELGIDPENILYDKARLIFSLSDLKGLKNNPSVNINGQEYNPEPAVDKNIPFEKGLQVSFILKKDLRFSFSYQMDIKGSNELNFLHIGKTTDVEVSSDWSNPGFNGRYLPDSRTLSKNGFGASWHMMYYNRLFPQQWVNDNTVLTGAKAKKEAVFGVKLQLAVDQYHTIMRTTKYSTLIIFLTFVSYF